MRRFILILEACIVVQGAALAQTASDNTNTPQLPVGQVFKQFLFPSYEDGKLKYTLFATEAKGVTLNRAATTDLKIEVYDTDGKTVTTTVTSPTADLYVADQRMRTQDTVRIERADMEATSQTCDFDVKSKKFLMRKNVKVLLKHFDLGSGQNGNSAGSTPQSTKAVAEKPTPAVASSPAVAAPSAPDMPSPARSTESLLTSPGTYGDTNSAPLPPPSTDTK